MAGRVISWRWRVLIFACVLALSAFIGWRTTRGNDANGENAAVATMPGVGISVEDPTIGTNPDLNDTPLPDLNIADLSGHEVTLRSLIGHPLVINLWNASCAPCKTEMPEFVKAQSQVGNEVRFVGIDTSDSASVAKKFADSVGAHYELYTDPQQASLNVLQLSVVPTTLFVSSNGRITSIQSGPLTAATLLARIHHDLLPG
jgi:thiol-disulfide isomerase/thioredoxin